MCLHWRVRFYPSRRTDIVDLVLGEVGSRPSISIQPLAENALFDTGATNLSNELLDIDRRAPLGVVGIGGLVDFIDILVDHLFLLVIRNDRVGFNLVRHAGTE